MSARVVVVVVVVAALVLGAASCRLFAAHIACLRDVECPADALCENGRCIGADGSEGEEGEGAAGGEGEGSAERTPCPNGNGDCTPAEACAGDGACTPRCTSDDQCPRGTFCGLTAILFGDQACVAGCRIADDGTDDCGADVCSAGTRRCVAAQASPRPVFGACANGSECSGNLVCSIFDGDDRGFCATPCDFSTCADCCGAGLTCGGNDVCGEDCRDGDCPGPACCPVSGLPACDGFTCRR
jgi:hypothetical protein